METTSYSRIYRVVHWAIAVTFLLLLITIFLRLTWMNKFNMADIIQEYLKGTDQTMTYDEIVLMAKQIRKPMWEWHINLGYVLVGLFSIRFTLPLFGTMKFQNPLSKDLSLKVRFQKWTYIIFYICVVGSLITGLLIEWGPKDWKKPVEEIHMLGIYYLVAFIVVHLAGVIIAELSSQKGIVSRIVSGKKEDSL
ncbi:MAG TPA: cytochrome b/b6 domain-containing protein [Aequorivita sp.]|nr:cytochrome b/b6 domain-containing protein [Aequorivita sp.]